jgi:hypothetical protein
MPVHLKSKKTIEWEQEHVRPSYFHINPDIIKWGLNYINQINNPCVDNFRMARAWKSSDCRRYQREKKKGCCGFFDELVVAPDGNKYLIGCNYGH